MLSFVWQLLEGYAGLPLLRMTLVMFPVLPRSCSLFLFCCDFFCAMLSFLLKFCGKESWHTVCILFFLRGFEKLSGKISSPQPHPIVDRSKPVSNPPIQARIFQVQFHQPNFVGSLERWWQFHRQHRATAATATADLDLDLMLSPPPGSGLSRYKGPETQLGGGNSKIFYFHPENWGRFLF